MPIKWVMHWQPNSGTTVNTQILTEVSQCVESINGVKDGRWKNTLSFYKPILKEVSQCVESINGVKDGRWKNTLSFYKPILKAEEANASEIPQSFLGISLHEQPDKYYMLIRGKRLIAEADSSILKIMETLQSYQTSVALNFEGFQFRLGDFQLRVGKVVPTNSDYLRGIVMEMEYLPISSWEISHQLMDEFFATWKEALGKRSLPGHFVHIEPQFSEYGLSDQYTSQHTAIQYANIVAKVVVTAKSSQGVKN